MVDNIREIFHENFRKYLDASGLQQKEFAKKIGVSATAVGCWYNGTKIPRMDKIELISKFFNIQKSDLLESNKNTNSAVKIPVLGTVIAGIPMEAVENIIDYEEISSQMASTGEYFCLQVKGNSMEPKFSEGDVVVVRKQSDVDTGEIAIVLVNGYEATIKKIKKRPDGVMLVPLNTSYEVMYYNNDEIMNKPVNIIGKVVELRAKF